MGELDTLSGRRALGRRRRRRRGPGGLREADHAVRDLEMGERSESFREGRHGVGDQVGEAEVVDGEDDDGMEVRVEAGDVGRKDGDGLGDGDEFPRLCLGCFCHNGRSIIYVVSLFDNN